MQVKVIDNALVIDLGGESPAMAVKDFSDKALAVSMEPAFYVALGANGLMERCVSVTITDRKAVAALVGNWIAEGFQPVPCDLKLYARHVRNLLAADKAAKAVAEVAPAPATPEAGVPAVSSAEVSATPES